MNSTNGNEYLYLINAARYKQLYYRVGLIMKCHCIKNFLQVLSHLPVSMHWSLLKWWQSTGRSRILFVKSSWWRRECELWNCHKTHIMKWRALCAHDKPANERNNARKRRKGKTVTLRIRRRSSQRIRRRSSQCSSQSTRSYPEKLISLFFLPTLCFQCGQNLNPLSK